MCVWPPPPPICVAGKSIEKKPARVLWVRSYLCVCMWLLDSWIEGFMAPLRLLLIVTSLLHLLLSGVVVAEAAGLGPDSNDGQFFSFFITCSIKKNIGNIFFLLLFETTFFFSFSLSRRWRRRNTHGTRDRVYVCVSQCSFEGVLFSHYTDVRVYVCVV